MLTKDGEHLYSNSTLSIMGFSMKGIQPEGRCPVCRGTFKKIDNIFVCPEHKTHPKRFTVYWFFKGKRFTRGTTLEGKPLESIAQAYALLNQAKREIESFRFDPTKWQAKSRIEFQFDRLIDKWFGEKQRLLEQGKLAPSYVPKLRTYIKHYVDYFGNTDVREILSCKDFVNSLPDKLSLKYQKNLTITLKNFFNWLKNEERIIDVLPTFQKIEVPEHIPTTISRDMQLKILSYIPEKDKPIFFFMVYQGCRPGEARALKWDCVNLAEQWVCYKRTFSENVLRETTKTKNIRYNYLFPETIKLLSNMPKAMPSAFVFINLSTGKPYHDDTINRIFNLALNKYNSETGSEIRIELYEFTKHSFGTQLYNQGVSIDLLQQHFGHTSIEMTRKYAKLKVVDAFRKIEEIKNSSSKKADLQ
jgi:integrase